MPKLTIGHACWDDVEGTFWTFSIIRQFHVQAGNKDVELLCIDDMEKPQKDLNHVCNLHGAKYIHKPKCNGPAHAKNSVFEEASGDYVLLTDSHVLLSENSIAYILNAIDRDYIQNDIWSGPLINESGHIYGTELETKWRGEFFGIWHTDPDLKSKKFKEIAGMGSAQFLMKRDEFPYFPKEFSGFAGEEIIISELVRQAGGKHFCHYPMQWQHRFLRSKPVSYRLTINDKFKNYMIGFYKCGFNTEAVATYFKKKLPINQHAVCVAEVLRIFPDLFEKNKDGAVFEELD